MGVIEVFSSEKLMNLGSSSGNSAGAGDRFPAGLRVLVVDDDPTCLMILEKMLRNCNYEVTKCNRAEVALSLLRENKSGYDVVISDVHMPDMDGFKLLVHIGLEMDLPVIMMSADDSKSVVMKGITHGACDYLIKPVRMEALRNIWQHVVRKRKHEREDIEPSVSLDEAEKKPPPEDPDSANEGHNSKNAKKRKEEEEDEDEEKEHSSSKKPRLVWSMELHQQFVAAVNQLGYDKAVPKKILDLMNVPGVTRENVASHLQKYRNYLKKLPHQPSGINPPFMANLDAGYGSLNQLPSISVPLIDQRNIFSFENPNPRYGQVQNRQGHNGNITKHMNLLHGVPTTMQPNQIAGFGHSFTGMNGQGLIPLTGQGQSQSHVSRHPILANGMVGIGNNFPHRGNLGIPPIVSTSTLQRVGSMESVQNRPQNRGFQGVDLTPNSFRDSNNMQGGLNAGGSKVIVSSAEGSWTHITDNSLPVTQPFGTEEYNPEDLLNPFLTQHENEFGFDWCSSENFPV